MSAGFGIGLGPNEDGYTVKRAGNCRLVYGPVPLADFAMLAHGFSPRAVLATDLADRIGATVVIGEPEDITALRGAGLPVSARRENEAQLARDRGLPAVAAWLRDGERGLSSNALCARLFDLPVGGREHPHDPDDWRRCMLFLDATGAHNRIGVMADVSPTWALLVARWDEIMAAWRSEQAKKSAPDTYALLTAVSRDAGG